MESLEVKLSGGFINCRSVMVGSIFSTYNDMHYHFSPGIYTFLGEIDSGAWALPYMLVSSPKDIQSFGEEFKLDNKILSLKELKAHCHNLDFRTLKERQSEKKTVRNKIETALIKSGMPYTVSEIQKMFSLTDFRLDRPISQVGNERFRSKAAIGFAEGKEIFCFPWVSRLKMEYYKFSFELICEVLEAKQKLVLLPCSEKISGFDRYTSIDFL